MVLRTHLFNTGAVLVGIAVGDFVKDRVKYKVGPLMIDGRLLTGVASILVSEYVPQVRANVTLRSALDLIGAVNLANWLYDQVKMLMAPAPATTTTQAPTQAQAGFPMVVVSAGSFESYGRII